MADTAAAEPQVRHKLQVYFDAHECRLTDQERADWADDCDTLAKSVGNFPQADLRVVVGRNGRSNEFSVKLTLLLPGLTLVGSDHDAVRHAAFERALVGLQENVTAYKERMSQVPERRRAEDGTVLELAPSGVPNAARKTPSATSPTSSPRVTRAWISGYRSTHRPARARRASS